MVPEARPASQRHPGLTPTRWLPRAVTALTAAAFLVYAAAVVGLIRQEEPWATWFYPLAWYPTLLFGELFLIRRRGHGLLLERPRWVLAALAWSVPFWLLFEAVNLRVANWFYVSLPPHPVARWTGIVLSFATVIPAVLVSREVMAAVGVGKSAADPTAPGTVRRHHTYLLQLLGVLFVAFTFTWPTYFFPLVWGAVTLLVDPWVYRRDPARSLLGAVERRHWAPILQLLAGGLVIGFLWELYNVQARGKWIYTVPGLEEVKLFEMPVPGFLGFPVLALDTWAVWNALELAGLVPGRWAGGARLSARARALVVALAVLGSVATAVGMERLTIVSTRPTLAEIVGDEALAARLAELDPFTLLRTDPAEVARRSGADATTVAAWYRTARLATLRGLGVRQARLLQAAGIRDVPELAMSDPLRVAEALGRTDRAGLARARVWIRAAREALARTG